MKVLIITPWYPSKEHPLDGDFVQFQALQLANGGIDTSVLHADLSYRFTHLARRTLKVTKNGLLREYILRGWAPPKWTRIGLWFWLKAYKSVYSRLIEDQGPPDLLHAHTFLGAYVARELSMRYQIPYIITEHSSAVYTNNLRPLHLYMLKHAYQDAQEIIVVSNAFKKRIQQWTTSTSVNVLPNFIDLQRFTPLGQAKKGNFTIIYTGNLIKRKGIEVLIHAFKELKSRIGIPLQLQIIGKGVMISHLQSLVRKLHLEEEISFLGKKSNQEVASYLQKAHLLVLPSIDEPFGISLIEALACGIPVVGTKNNGAEDIINKEVGVLANPGDISSLTEAISQVIEHYTIYDQTQIRAYAEAEFDLKKLPTLLLDKYKMYIN